MHPEKTMFFRAYAFREKIPFFRTGKNTTDAAVCTDHACLTGAEGAPRYPEGYLVRNCQRGSWGFLAGAILVIRALIGFKVRF
uniref:Uncharacterized protein n=1 Tax=Candidatus Kentrum sp. TUN TaxID=2126343 RepID=A0A450ZG00_9GAMM|nr:MAG: hypothetical protein BECKTUN1418F_GA0071002_101225 [Candidatus Kentron sp. TUN]VFK53287.1 MAG: hypothetical protein BECKTUN1418E_GA0071001_101425 [Candidatus Kentron sp. TUN]VFK60474.1 MAG: hypothetical protein BECKTUN1418D_GA0071000_11247 [Candidatus Kentron sp. TUN]